jgi:hypothetical protein
MPTSDVKYKTLLTLPIKEWIIKCILYEETINKLHVALSNF